MAIEGTSQELASQSVSPEQKWNSASPTTMNSGSLNGCFDCNICLDTTHNPVVTLCGHLYCWPCIYKWLHVLNSSPDLDDQPKCPVCKAIISSSSLVPLYGCGTSTAVSEAKMPPLGPIIPTPPRPRATGGDLLTTSRSASSAHDQQSGSHPFSPRQPTLQHEQFFSHPSSNLSYIVPFNFGDTTAEANNVFSPTVSMIAEMVSARIFRSSETRVLAYPYANAFSIPGTIPGTGGNPRIRRQEMELNKSLNRVSIFLFCCCVLCLLLF